MLIKIVKNHMIKIYSPLLYKKKKKFLYVNGSYQCCGYEDACSRDYYCPLTAICEFGGDTNSIIIIISTSVTEQKKLYFRRNFHSHDSVNFCLNWNLGHNFLQFTFIVNCLEQHFIICRTFGTEYNYLFLHNSLFPSQYYDRIVKFCPSDGFCNSLYLM